MRKLRAGTFVPARNLFIQMYIDVGIGHANIFRLKYSLDIFVDFKSSCPVVFSFASHLQYIVYSAVAVTFQCGKGRRVCKYSVNLRSGAQRL